MGALWPPVAGFLAVAAQSSAGLGPGLAFRRAESLSSRPVVGGEAADLPQSRSPLANLVPTSSGFVFRASWRSRAVTFAERR
jgi:hypothetical protein